MYLYFINFKTDCVIGSAVIAAPDLRTAKNHLIGQHCTILEHEFLGKSSFKGKAVTTIALSQFGSSDITDIPGF